MSEAVAEPRLVTAPRRLTTVVAADICGYSRLAEIDDDAAIRTVNFVRAAFEQVVERRRGRLFHTAGDGFLAEFPSAADGVLAALEFVADMKARDKLSPINPGAKVRAGVHAGDVIEQPNGDLLGHGVNIAARLQAEAAPNGVLVSLAIVNLVRDSAGAQFQRRGSLALRNIEEPVVAFDAALSTTSRLNAAAGNLRRLLSRLSMSTVLFAALGSCLVAITGVTLQKTIRQEAATNGTPNTSAPSFDISILSSGEKDYLDRAYLTEVLKSLVESGTDSSRAALALLEAGDAERAVQMLTAEVDMKKADDLQFIEINHQIGAITELSAPETAAAAFERILARDPQNFFAAARLAHARLAQNQVSEARRLYDLARNLNDKDPRLTLQLDNEAAFALVLERDMDAAIREYRAIAKRASDLGFEEVEVSARASLGLALSFANRPSEAREQFLSVLFAQPENLYISSKARAAWGLGQIARQNGDLRSAERFYSRSLEYETLANRAHGRASSLFGLGLTNIAIAELAPALSPEALSQLDLATRRMEESLKIAEQNGLIFHINMALVGLAQIHKLRKDQTKSCSFIARSEALLNTHKIRFDAVNPEIRVMVEETTCPFRLVAN